jgi:protoheme IX farnesyltransferase
VPDTRPGAWLRLTAFAAAAACTAAVVTGALELGAAHRGLAVLALPPLAALTAAAWVAHRRLLVPSLTALGAFLLAALVTPRPAHLALAGLSLAAALWAAVETFRGEPVAAASWRDYVILTKPRIMTLLLLTGVAGMFVGARGVPALNDLTVMTVGLALACGGASALNHVLDRDLDRLMRRTGHRPVAEERVAPARALEFGLALMAFSFVLLASLVNVLTAALALVGGLFYVLVYTRWLKQTTPQNIVIGGAAGAVPPLVGWAAATGNLTLPALFLFLIVFFWTPPHFWALALVIKRDYAAAHVPMLPVVRGDDETARQIVWYSLVLVAVTLLPFAWHTVGVLYLAAALLLGAFFLRLAWRLQRETTTARAGALFRYSLLYLALLFVALAIDPLIG